MCFLAFLFCLSLSAQESTAKQNEKKEAQSQETQSQEKKISTMEEILVYGKISAEQPLATVSYLPETKIEHITPLVLVLSECWEVNNENSIDCRTCALHWIPVCTGRK
jgi:hypothetical protein